MANKLYNIAGMSTATVGIANLVLGAALPGMITFNNAGVLNADVVSYSIRDGINTEVGQGTYTTVGALLSRDVVYNSTNGGAKIVLSGTSSVYIAVLASDVQYVLPAGGAANQILKNAGLVGQGAWGTVTESAGALAAITTINMSNQLTNTLAIGTSPFAVTSTTVNANLNADLLDGQHGAYYAVSGGEVILAPATSVRNVIQPTGDFIALTVKGNATQTANLQEWQKSTAAVQISFDDNGGAIFNEAGNAAGDFRVESDTEANIVFLDASADTVQFGGTVNSTQIAKGGRYSHLGTARKTWTKYTAASVTITVGGADASSIVANLQTMADGNFFHLDEVAATPAIDMYVEFTGVTAFEKVRALGIYAGSATHAVAVQVRNWSVANQWDTFNAMQTGKEDTTTANGYIMGNYEFRVYDDTNYIGTGGDAGKVRVRFYHTMAGSAAHDFYLDEVSLRQ